MSCSLYNSVQVSSRAWNQLPTDLKLLRLTASFKNELESFLFHAAYTGNTV